MIQHANPDRASVPMAYFMLTAAVLTDILFSKASRPCGAAPAQSPRAAAIESSLSWASSGTTSIFYTDWSGSPNRHAQPSTGYSFSKYENDGLATQYDTTVEPCNGHGTASVTLKSELSLTNDIFRPKLRSFRFRIRMPESRFGSKLACSSMALLSCFPTFIADITASRARAGAMLSHPCVTTYK